jgi:TolB-like protein
MTAVLTPGRTSICFGILAAALLFASAGSAWADSSTPKQRIIVVPFALLNTQPDQAWMSKAIQDNTVAELGRSPYLNPIAHAGALPNSDAATAARIARANDAPYAVYGSAQVIDQTVRITAQLVSSRTGDTLGTATSTGPLTDLLRLEDDIVTQLRPIAAALPASTATAIAQPAPQPQAPSAPAPAYDPHPEPYLSLDVQTVHTTPPVYPSYPYYSGYSYPYSYGYYPYASYGYPYYAYSGCYFPATRTVLISSTGPSNGPLTPGTAAASPGVVNLSALDTINRLPPTAPAHARGMH